MNGKELVTKAFKLEKTSRTPWVPFVGCHGAKLLNVSVKEYLNSEKLIFEGVSKAIELYKPDGIPVIFDLQIEAEALGCELQWLEKNPPSVISHILLSGKSVDELQIPSPNAKRISVALNAAKLIRKKFPDIALYGLITGPFTLALHLLGTDIFMKMLTEPDEIHKILNFTKKVAIAMAQYYIDAGCDVIALVDPMTSQIDTDSFKIFISQPASEIFGYIRKCKKLSSFFVCGHAQHNIEEMCKCKPDNISIDDNISLDFVKKIALDNNVSFGGNIKLTVVLLMGTPEDCQLNATECIEMAGDIGFILAPGCDIPFDTPPENIMAITELVNNKYIQETIKAKDINSSGLEIIDMKDYGSDRKVIIDVITLDSQSCAPCQYMVEAVKRVAPFFEGIVEWREHTIKKIEGVSFMNSLMVKNIPAICIDGKIAFVSQIPPQSELIAAIQKRINEKFKLFITSRNAEILIIAKDENEAIPLKENISKALKQTGKNLKLKISTDNNLRLSFGIISTPAVIITENKIKSQGEIPKVDIIKEWLKEL
jgi:uroporphyrinogen decarboxylase